MAELGGIANQRYVVFPLGTKWLEQSTAHGEEETPMVLQHGVMQPHFTKSGTEMFPMPIDRAGPLFRSAQHASSVGSVFFFFYCECSPHAGSKFVQQTVENDSPPMKRLGGLSKCEVVWTVLDHQEPPSDRSPHPLSQSQQKEPVDNTPRSLPTTPVDGRLRKSYHVFWGQVLLEIPICKMGCSLLSALSRWCHT